MLRALIDALESGEDSMLQKLYKYASEAEYTKYTRGTKEEDWRMTLREPARALIEYLKRHDKPELIHVDEDFLANTSAAFGVLEAKRHRERGVRFDMFMGLTKLVRQAFVDLVYEASLSEEERKTAFAIVHRFFDKFELGFSSEWVRYQETEVVRDLQSTNRVMTNEKNRYLTIFRSMGDAAFVVDPEMRLMEINDAFEGRFGFSKHQLNGRKCYEVVGADLCKSCPLEQAIAQKISFENIETVICGNGEERTTMVSGAALDDISGKNVGGIVILKDITGRKRMEKELRKQQEEQQIILDSVPAIIFYKDKEDRFLRVNEVLAKAVNMPKEELVGKTAAEISPSDDKDYYADDKEIMASGEPKRNIIEPLETPEGMRWVQTDKIPYRDGEGNIIGVIGFAIDITERKHAEAALQESARVWQDTFDAMIDGVGIADTNGTITQLNANFVKLHGYESPKELIGRKFFKLTAERDLPKVMGVFKEFMEEKRSTHSNLELIQRRKDGGEFPALISIAELRDEEGKTLGSIAVIRDITDRKRMEEELQRVDKLESIGTLAGGIAHDLNNFLTGIVGNISLAMMYDDPLEKDKRLVEADRACMQVKDLTQQLLTFSKGGAPILRTAAIGNLLRDSASFTLRGSNVGSELSIPDNLWPAEIDEGQVNQVINNLIINSQQAMPGGGTLKIRAENITIGTASDLPLEPGAYIKVSVEDQGIGITQEHLQKIFDPFFTTKQAGNGLGLATSYSIIEKHKGHISVESRIGVGTTFHIYLPATPGGGLMDEEETEKKTIMGKGRVLVMDDEKHVRDTAASMLSIIGYEFITAIDGAGTIEIYKEAMSSDNSFDAIILDLTIPGGMGGKETIQRLMEIDPEAKAIVSSGYSSDPILANFRKYGFMGFIPKPYGIQELSEVLHRVVQVCE